MAEKLDLENMTIADEDSSIPSRDVNSKRTSYLDWDEYFMASAFLAAMRSKDPVTQVGACIVNEHKKIVGIGYNGMPTGCSDDDFPWGKEAKNQSDTKYLYVCHAELNAILNKNTGSVGNWVLYVGLFPCNNCAQTIIQSGIKKVIYMSDKHRHKARTIAAKRLFDAANVDYCQYEPKNKKIVIDFSEINWNAMTQLPPSPINDRNGHIKIQSINKPDCKNIVIDIVKDNSNDVAQLSLTAPEKRKRDVNNKRSNYLDWDEYFMSMAFLAAMRSKDPVTQVGACIVNQDKKIVSVGYNGMPIGCHDDDFPWGKEAKDKLDTKYLYVCHAELNAILNKNASNIENCSMYVGLFPCNECAKAVIQSGIKKVFYMSDKHKHKITTIAAKRMFDAAKVEYRQYQPKNEKVIINFSEIRWDDMNQLPPTPKMKIRA